MAHLVVIGMLTVDVLLATDDAPSTLRMVHREAACVGGKGYIVAHTAAAFGVDVDLVCELPVSPEFPEDLCIDVGYDHSARVLHDPDRTWTVHRGSQEETTFVRLGERHGPAPAYVNTLSALTGADAWYVAAAPLELLEAVVSVDASRRPPLVLNASNALLSVVGGSESTLLATLLRLADTVIVNQAEFQALTTQDAVSEGRIEGPLETVPIIVITIGPGGAVIRRSGSSSIDIVNTVAIQDDALATTLGAGDVFIGAWLASFLAGASGTEACAAANEAARSKLLRFSSHL